MRAPRFITDLTAPTRPMPDAFRQLCVLDNRLLGLWDDACYYRRYWAGHPIEQARGKMASWYGIRDEMARLVGFGRPDGDDILGSKHAFDCARKALMDAMGV